MAAEGGLLVLLVEDTLDTLEAFTHFLQSAGFRVETAMNGRQAVEMARALRPDVIVMDLALPEVDGWEATHQIKSDPLTRHTPVFLYIWSTGGAKALRDPVNKVDRIPMLAESISEELVDPKALPFSFVIGPTYEDQIRLALESFKKQGGKRVAIARCNLD